MVIIKFCGALGNQLFQFSLYTKMKLLGKEVKADISAFSNGDEKRYYYLDKLGIELDLASKEELDDFFVRKSIRFVPGFLRRRKYYFEKEPYSFNANIFKYDDCYLEGYWQNYKYFDDIKDVLKKEIKFAQLPKEQEKIALKMAKENSVAVHVRLGDYIKLYDLYGGICGPDYYDRAFSYMSKNISNPVYYGFSDDIPAASKLLGKYKIEWVDQNTEENAIYDLILMTKT